MEPSDSIVHVEIRTVDGLVNGIGEYERHHVTDMCCAMVVPLEPRSCFLRVILRAAIRGPHGIKVRVELSSNKAGCLAFSRISRREGAQ